MHCVDLGESFQTHIYLQNSASIQPRTSPVKFAAAGGVLAARSAGPPHHITVCDEYPNLSGIYWPGRPMRG